MPFWETFSNLGGVMGGKSRRITPPNGERVAQIGIIRLPYAIRWAKALGEQNEAHLRGLGQVAGYPLGAGLCQT
jgi:hypothetical protein